MPTNTLIATGRDCAPPLTPKRAPWMMRFVEQPAVAKRLLEENGSPVHVVVASEFRRNVKDLLSPIQARGLTGGLFFARKANKLPWFVSLAGQEGIGVDTASLREVEETIALGVPPEKITITAIGKESKLVTEALKHGCMLVIDNADELALVRALARAQGRNARIGIRFSGFEVNGRRIFSRFGLPIADADAILKEVSQDDCLQLELLHAHLDRYDVEERACAARQLAELSDRAAALGLKITAIDMGGGILMRYLESAEQWQKFQTSLVSSVAGEIPSFTYLGDGLGYYKVGNEVLGRADLYPAWNNLSKERFIAAVLDFEHNGTPLHKEFSGRGLKLYFEPGRALLDNVGITLANVTFRKRDTEGNLLVGTAMNRMNLRPFRAEFCTDPMLLSTGSQEQKPEGAFLVGNLCSESDLIFRRKIKLDHLPQPGEIFCFFNTAGYLAHHMEIGTHGNPLPVNLLIDEETFAVKEVFGKEKQVNV